MTPTVVHRYSFLQREAIGCLLGDELGDCLRWEIRVDGDQLVVDIVEPAMGVRSETPSSDRSNEEISKQDRRLGTDSAPSTEKDPGRKGGVLAQRAGIMCGERGFWRFAGELYQSRMESAADAAIWLREHCGVASRADLDHKPTSATTFREVEQAYRMWLDGY